MKKDYSLIAWIISVVLLSGCIGLYTKSVSINDQYRALMQNCQYTGEQLRYATIQNNSLKQRGVAIGNGIEMTLNSHLLEGNTLGPADSLDIQVNGDSLRVVLRKRSR